jgi:hypothetical protein
MVADQPICYTVNDFAVVFSPKSAETAVLYTKIFHVDPKTFVQAIQKVCSVTITKDDLTAAGAQSKQSAGQIIVNATNSPAQVHKMILAYFNACGIDLSPPKLLFFNDRLGELLVRGSLKDLEIIQQAIELLNRP